MPRTMLQLRMQALERHLREAQDPSRWKDNLVLERFVVDEELWLIAIEKIHEEAMTRHDAIKELINEVAQGACTEPHAWQRYTTIQAESEDIFRECLELLGGLALRDRINDEHICHFADELIKEQAKAVGRMSRFTIPVLNPVLDRSLPLTLRRVATVRFPEWHLWTLPLVTHEYAQALLAEYVKLDQFARQLADDEIDAGNSTQASAQDEQGETQAEAARESLERKKRVLLADAVATYTTGPAYACAALILRLSPFARANNGSPSDEDRAAVILGVLQSMSSAKPPPFTGIADKLRTYWQESVAAARNTHGQVVRQVDLTPSIDPQQIVDRLRRTFFRPNIEYTGQHWLEATTWSSAWANQLANAASDLTVPPVEPKHKLRDALNASWHCRVETAGGLDPTQAEGAEEVVGQIADVGRKLCQAIIGKTEPPPAASGPGSPPQP
jgi:hypothetical protein